MILFYLSWVATIFLVVTGIRRGWKGDYRAFKVMRVDSFLGIQLLMYTTCSHMVNSDISHDLAHILHDLAMVAIGYIFHAMGVFIGMTLKIAIPPMPRRLSKASIR